MVDEENEARRRASDLWWVELKISATRLGPLSGFRFFLAIDEASDCVNHRIDFRG